MKITILGCGSSFGVPSIRDGWGECDFNNKKNLRSRSSIMLSIDDKNILIDTSPDLRQQLLSCQFDKIDAVLWTHYHYDHICGINELCSTKKLPIECYGDDNTLRCLNNSFNYCFEKVSCYQPFCKINKIDGIFNIDSLQIIPITHQHGDIQSLGFRIGNFSYNVDFNNIDDYNLSLLKGIELWIVEASSLMKHYSHSSLSYTLELIDYINPKKVILTNLDTNLDYQKLTNILPEYIEVAYDGMILDYDN